LPLVPKGRPRKAQTVGVEETRYQWERLTARDHDRRNKQIKETRLGS